MTVTRETRETREKINNEMADKVRDAIVRSRATRNASDADARFLKALTKERFGRTVQNPQSCQRGHSLNEPS